jgi:hypothetical protein
MENKDQSQKFDQFFDLGSYQDLLGDSYPLANLTIYHHPRVDIQLPAFSFVHLPEQQQLEIAQQLVDKAKNKGKKLIYEIGYGNSLSPLDTALTESDSLVLGFDPNGNFPKLIKSGTEEIKFPSSKINSLTALFSLNSNLLIKNNFPKADRVQCISPYPTMVKDMVNQGLELSDKVIILPNPNQIDSKEFQKIIDDLPLEYSGEIKYLSKEELINEIGTSSSKYIFPSNQEKTPLITVWKKE